LEVVKLLLAKDADVNAQGGEYGTALRVASLGGHLEVVKLLLGFLSRSIANVP
jgi:ankyrin repeat protein